MIFLNILVYKDKTPNLIYKYVDVSHQSNNIQYEDKGMLLTRILIHSSHVILHNIDATYIHNNNISMEACTFRHHIFLHILKRLWHNNNVVHENNNNDLMVLNIHLVHISNSIIIMKLCSTLSYKILC